MNTFKYRPEVDGLRALAVLPVVLFHAGFEAVGGGFVGVDVFFVISGYLITTIIISEMAAGKFTITSFYERRARRILPALFFILAVCLPFAWFWLPADAIDRFGGSLASASLFVSNVFFLFSYTGYFKPLAELSPLIHLWSISVEEQYYIFYPVFLILAWRLGTKWIVVLLALVFVISLGIAVSAIQSDQLLVLNAAYYLLPTRAWELLVGGFIAIYFHHKTHLNSQGVNQFLSLLGLGMIIYSYANFDRHTPYPSLYTLIPTIGTALIIFCAVPSTIVNKLLSLKMLVGIGLISYSAYLWHQPLLAFARFRVLGELSYSVVVPICFASFFLAWITWKYVESPFRNRQNFSRKSIFLLSAAGISIFSAIGLTLTLNNGFPAYNQAYNKDVIAERLSQIGIKNYQVDRKTLQLESLGLVRHLYGEDYEVEGNSADRRNNFDLSSHKKRLLLVGNSHSIDVFNLFYYSDELSRQFDLARFGIQLPDIDAEFYTSDAYKHSQIVMIATMHSHDSLGVLEEVANRILDDNKQLVVVEEALIFHTSGTATAADFTIARELKRGQQTGKPITADDIIRKVNSVYTNVNQQYISQPRYLEIKKHFEEVKATIIAHDPQVVFVNRMDYICPENQCHGLTSDGRKAFYDYTHQTLAGSIFFAEQVHKTKFYRDLMEGLEQ